MSGLLMVPCVLSLVTIAYQDFKDRSISVTLLIILGGAFIITGITTLNIRDWVEAILINWAIIFIQMGTIKLLFSVRHGRNVKLADELIGWGDIVFLFLCGLFFSPVNFILFYIIGLTTVAVFYKIYSLKDPAQERHVPLAGGLCICFIGLLFLQLLRHGVSFQNDNCILNYIGQYSWK